MALEDFEWSNGEGTCDLCGKFKRSLLLLDNDEVWCEECRRIHLVIPKEHWEEKR